MKIYRMPISSPQRNAPVERVYQAKTTWMQPVNTSSQATNRFTVIPATCGNAIARKPATIIRTLSPMDSPTDFFTMVPTDVALIIYPSSLLDSRDSHFGTFDLRIVRRSFRRCNGYRVNVSG